MKLRVPYFEVKRMVKKALEIPEIKYYLKKSRRKLLEERYLGDELKTYKEIAELHGKSASGIALNDIETLNIVRKLLKQHNLSEYITELQPTV